MKNNIRRRQIRGRFRRNPTRFASELPHPSRISPWCTAPRPRPARSGRSRSRGREPHRPSSSTHNRRPPMTERERRSSQPGRSVRRDADLCGDRGARDAGGRIGRHDGNRRMAGADRLASRDRRGGRGRHCAHRGCAGRATDDLAAVARLQRAPPGAGLTIIALGPSCPEKDFQ